MTVPSLPGVSLSIADPLVSRVLQDVLRAAGFKPDATNATLVLTDEGAEKFQALAKNGMRAVMVRPPSPGAKIRAGAVLLSLHRLINQNRAASGTIAFGPFTLDLSNSTLADGRTDSFTILTEKERDLLSRLHQEKGRTLDRNVLLQDIWGYRTTVETHTLETHIYRLRQKIEKDPSAPDFLVTEGNGYRLKI